MCPEDNVSTAEMEDYIASLNYRLSWAERQVPNSSVETIVVILKVTDRKDNRSYRKNGSVCTVADA
jgi:hypothetical protein